MCAMPSMAFLQIFNLVIIIIIIIIIVAFTTVRLLC
jgi:hypothetical protein